MWLLAALRLTSGVPSCGEVNSTVLAKWAWTCATSNLKAFQHRVFVFVADGVDFFTGVYTGRLLFRRLPLAVHKTWTMSFFFKPYRGATASKQPANFRQSAQN